MNAITLKALFYVSGVAVGGLLLFSSFETKATERWGIGSALVAESVEVALTRVAELGVEKMDLENSGVKILKGNELTTEVSNAERLAAEQGVEMTGAVRPYEETAATEKPTTRVVHITKADFLKKVYDFEKNPDEWKYLGSQPAIVDFYADWCGPCRQLSPVLDELAKEYSGKLTIYKVNVDNERGLATFFGIRSIPTLLFIPMKGKPQRSLGALSKTELKGIIKDVLKVEL